MAKFLKIEDEYLNIEMCKKIKIINFGNNTVIQIVTSDNELINLTSASERQSKLIASWIDSNTFEE